MQTIIKEKAVCFTGHRPEKIKVDEDTLWNDLNIEIVKSINEGKNIYICGMSRGVDIIAGEIISEIKKIYDGITLICAVPYSGFETRWNYEWQNRYSKVLKNADHIEYVCSNYSPDCFQKRNMWMVNNSSKVIAYYNGEQGGTLNTINYAKQKGIKVVNVYKEK